MPWNCSWIDRVWAASLEGGLILLLVWAVLRALPVIGPQWRRWFWWLALGRLLFCLFLPASLPGISFAPPLLRGLAHPGRTHPGALPLALFLCWAAGLLFQARHTAERKRRARALVDASDVSNDPMLLGEAQPIALATGLSGTPFLRLSRETPGPVVTGLFRASVLLPHDCRERYSAEELRLALAHEFAHLKQGDLLLAWVPGLSRALFFFHPLVRVAYAEWLLASEGACDGRALRVTGVSRKTLGRFLVRTATETSPVPPVVAWEGAAAHRQLQRRLEDLYLPEAPPAVAGWLARAALATLAALVVPWSLLHRPPIRAGMSANPAGPTATLVRTRPGAPARAGADPPHGDLASSALSPLRSLPVTGPGLSSGWVPAFGGPTPSVGAIAPSGAYNRADAFPSLWYSLARVQGLPEWRADDGVPSGPSPRPRWHEGIPVIGAEFVPAPSHENTVWRDVAWLPSGREEPAAAVGSDGRLYVIGGSGGREDDPSVTALDPHTGHWSALPTLPAGRQGPAAAAWGRGVYVFGGIEGRTATYLDSVLHFDPRTKVWKPVRRMPTPRYCPVAVKAGWRILVIGGTNASSEELSAVEAYDPARDVWESLPPLNTPRTCAGAVATPDGRVYVMGGMVKHDTVTETVEVFDGKSWRPGPPMRRARCSFVAALGRDGRVYAVGGYDPTAGASLADAEALDPRTGRWAPVPGLDAPRSGAAGAALSDGRIFVAGGVDFEDRGARKYYYHAVRALSPEDARAVPLRGRDGGTRSGPPEIDTDLDSYSAAVFRAEPSPKLPPADDGGPRCIRGFAPAAYVLPDGLLARGFRIRVDGSKAYMLDNLNEDMSHGVRVPEGVEIEVYGLSRGSMYLVYRMDNATPFGVAGREARSFRLEEPGEYFLTARISRGGMSRAMPFQRPYHLSLWRELAVFVFNDESGTMVLPAFSTAKTPWFVAVRARNEKTELRWVGPTSHDPKRLAKR